MKLNIPLKIRLLALAAILVAGCATRIDWNSRIGHYTYDQAVMEFGPPDKEAHLTNGKRVADWVTHYASSGTVIAGPGYYYPGSVGYIETIQPSEVIRTLRLTFDTNNVLYAWAKL